MEEEVAVERAAAAAAAAVKDGANRRPSSAGSLAEYFDCNHLNKTN